MRYNDLGFLGDWHDPSQLGFNVRGNIKQMIGGLQAIECLHSFHIKGGERHKRIGKGGLRMLANNHSNGQSNATSHQRITAKQIRGILEGQDYRCALTGRKLTPKTASLDHIVPLSRGGLHRIENAEILEMSVNMAKGTMTNEEFVSMCREVVAWCDRDLSEEEG